LQEGVSLLRADVKGTAYTMDVFVYGFAMRLQTEIMKQICSFLGSIFESRKEGKPNTKNARWSPDSRH
jgi:hypothetical protein